MRPTTALRLRVGILGLRLVGALLVVLCAAPAARAAYDLEVVARSDEPLPGRPGDVVENFAPDLIGLSDDGHLLFGAQVDFWTNVYLLDDEMPTLLMRDTAPAPGDSGMVFTRPYTTDVPGLSRIFLAPNGQVELHAWLTDPTFTRPNASALFRTTLDPDPQLITHVAPQQSVGSFDVTYAGSGLFAGTQSLISVVDPDEPGSLGLALESNGLAGIPAYGKVMAAFEELSELGDVFVQSVHPHALGTTGRMLYTAFCYDRIARQQFTVLIVQDPDGTREFVVDDRNLGDPQDYAPLIVREAQVAPDGSMAFRGLTPAFPDLEGIYRLSIPGGTAVQAQVGGVAVGTGGATFTNFGAFVQTDADEVYFVAETSDQRMGLWRAEPFGVHPVAIAGDQIPGQFSGRRYGDSRVTWETGFGNVLLGASGEVFFTCRIQGNAPELAIGLFRVRAGVVEPVIQVGDRIEGQTITGLNVLGSGYGFGFGGGGGFGVNGRSGQTSPVNARGEIAFVTMTSDFETQLVLARPALVVNSTGDRADAEPGDGICSCDPIDQVPEGEEPECTLRAAIEEANSDPALDRIRFVDPGGSWRMISLGEPLPPLSTPIDLEGPLNAVGPRPKWSLRSAGLSGPALLIVEGSAADGSRTAIRNLGIVTSEIGIDVARSDVSIEGNWIGVHPWLDGATDVTHAVRAVDASGLVVGNNRLDGARTGLWMDDCIGALVRGNRVGDGADDQLDLPTRQLLSTGILIDGGRDHRVGGVSFDDGNVIAGVKLGIHLLASARENHVLGNRIGTDRDGTAVVPNAQTGIQITAASRNRIGQGTRRAGEFGGNVIVGSPWGIRVRGASARHNEIRGNLLGALPDGTVDTDHGEVGIEVTQGAFRTVVGGGRFDTAFSGNLIEDYLQTEIDTGGGIVLRGDVYTDVLGNSIYDCTYGIALDGSQIPNVSGNAIWDCFIALRAEAAPVDDARLGANRIESEHPAGTGMVLDAGSYRILGNSFVVPQDAIALDAEAFARIEGNCFQGVGDHGVRAQLRTLPVDATGNWWGDLNGPSGTGRGSGAAVSDFVDYDPWMSAKNGVLVVDGGDGPIVIDDTLPEDRREIITWGITEYEPADSTIVLEFADSLGWFEPGPQRALARASSAQFEVVLNDAGSGVLEVELAIPVGTPAGTMNAFTLSLDGEVLDVSRRTVASAQLASIDLSAPRTTIGLGATIDLIAIGRDVAGNAVPFAALWSASSGTIDEAGRFIAPDSPGVVDVSVSDAAGTVSASLALEVTGSVSIADPIDDDGTVLPTRLALAPNRPNPFNPSTLIEFSLPRLERVRLDVFNVRGERVRTLIGGDALEPGVHQRSWNGTDDRDQPVASGVYFYRLDAGTKVLSRRMLLVK